MEKFTNSKIKVYKTSKWYKKYFILKLNDTEDLKMFEEKNII